MACDFINNLHPGDTVGALSFVRVLEENVGGATLRRRAALLLFFSQSERRLLPPLCSRQLRRPLLRRLRAPSSRWSPVVRARAPVPLLTTRPPNNLPADPGDLESIHVRTVGVKNMDVVKELRGTALPAGLFDEGIKGRKVRQREPQSS